MKYLTIGCQLPESFKDKLEKPVFLLVRQYGVFRPIFSFRQVKPPMVKRAFKAVGLTCLILPPEGNVEDDQEAQGDSTEPSSNTEENVFYGPALPPDMQPSEYIHAEGAPAADHSVPVDQEEESGCEIGPLPEMAEKKEHDEVYLARLSEVRRSKESKVAHKTREEWMTELPSAMKQYGLGARSFQKRDAGDRAANRSLWTKLPTDAIPEEAENTSAAAFHKVLELQALRTRDEKMDKDAGAWNQDRSLSLVEINRQNRKRKAELNKREESEKVERRPFDRNVDLKVSGGFANSSEVLQRASDLGSRFGHSSAQNDKLLAVIKILQSSQRLDTEASDETAVGQILITDTACDNSEQTARAKRMCASMLRVLSTVPGTVMLNSQMSVRNFRPIAQRCLGCVTNHRYDISPHSVLEPEQVGTLLLTGIFALFRRSSAAVVVLLNPGCQKAMTMFWSLTFRSVPQSPNSLRGV
ncbi:unnamed protein product [Soboliphyme baturini]|uniref:DUF3752 domain-containing protein n=1 Tax=Soboliphyme baturini TaxID=241478 RepID=A0A183IK07_9BILA|nr:unnamed protein product [Soboliphyme baturini]